MSAFSGRIQDLIGKRVYISAGYGTISGYHNNTLIVDLACGGTERVYLFGNWREIPEETYKALM